MGGRYFVSAVHSWVCFVPFVGLGSLCRFEIVIRSFMRAYFVVNGVDARNLGAILRANFFVRDFDNLLGRIMQVTCVETII